MIKLVSYQECIEILVSYGYSPEAAEALTVQIQLDEDESQEDYCLGASILCEWEEFHSFQSAQAAVGGAYIPKGINFSGGFLMRK